MLTFSLSSSVEECIFSLLIVPIYVSDALVHRHTGGGLQLQLHTRLVDIHCNKMNMYNIIRLTFRVYDARPLPPKSAFQSLSGTIGRGHGGGD